jgi:serine/threonine-protein kinase
MSPEQAMGREIDGRSDIFSLGAVLYEMLTARYAFDGDSLPTILYRVINEIPVPAVSLRSGVSDGMSHLLTRMLHKNPAERPDARVLLEDLHALAQANPPTPTAVPSSHKSRLHPVLVFGIPLAVLLAIGIGMLDRERPPDTPQPTVPVQVQPAAGSPVPETTPVDSIPVESATDTPDKDASGATPIETDAYLAGLDSKRVKLRLKRTELLLEYTDQHPDVVQIDRQLELLQIERRRYLRQLESKQKN